MLTDNTCSSFARSDVAHAQFRAGSIMAEKDESDDLTCTVCLEEFREPKLLPCCHTFCKGCLERILEKSRQKKRLSCPQCRAEHEVTESGPSALLTDFTVLQAFRIRRLTTMRKSCGMCSGEGVQPVSFCEACEEYLCGYCDGAHKRMKVFTDHSVVPLGEFKPESFIPKPKPYYCQQHPQNVVQFFCQTCNQLVCGNCVVQSRNPFPLGGSRQCIHTFTALNDGLKPMEEELQKLVDSADYDRKQCESSLNSLEEIQKQQAHHVQQLKTQVNTAVDLYIKVLQDSCVQTLAEIDAKHGRKNENAQVHKQQLQTAVSHINSGLRFAMKALQCHDDTERIAMMGRATSQLKQPTKHMEIQNMLETPPLVVKDLKATFQTLLVEFKSEDIKVTSSHLGINIGEKAELEVTISTKPVGEPKFQIKYGSSYKCSLTPQTVVLEPDKWLLKFTPSCGGRHIVSVCIYGVWVSGRSSVWEHRHPTFYVGGRLKEGDTVRRMPHTDRPLFSWTTLTKSHDTKETGKVTKVLYSTSKAGNLSCDVEVEWNSGEKSEKESFQWGDVHGHPLELAL